MRTRDRILQALRALLPAFVVLFATARAAEAQLSHCPDGNCPPTITVTPDGGAFTSSSLSVSITWSEDGALNASSRWIKLNGNTITSSFSYSGNSTYATSSGTITLASGSNTFQAHMCDTTGLCTTKSVTYVKDTTAPTASMTPNGGYYNTSSVSLTINWGDNNSLDSGTRSITVTGTDVTSSFSYSGNATSATSSGTITLSTDINLVRAHICDTAGNCTNKSVNFYYDATSPGVSVSPNGGTVGSASQSVTVTWTDNYGLNSGSRWIKLNGSTITSSFGYSGGATSATSSGTVTLVAGSNTFQAHICDTAGNCTTHTSTFTYDASAPGVSVTPNSGTFGSASQSVTVTWTDNYGLNSGSRWIKLNGSTITSSFGYSGSATSATSSGTITLVAGSNTFQAHICDQVGHCTTHTSTFTYDASAPGVSVTPNSGTFGSAAQSLTITWTDNYGLNSGSRWIKLNGSTITSSFGYSGSATSATSSGTVTLVAGSNTFQAHICDQVGHCTTHTSTYIYDAAAPTVAVSPNSGSYTVAARSITITWGDNYGLNSGSRDIKLNGSGVNGSFHYYGSATTAYDTGTVTLATGSNTFTAKICDNVGHCTTHTSTYTYDGAAPGVTVTPSSGTYNVASRSITIDWSDNLSLDSGSRDIKLNGSSVNGSFHYYGSATSAHDTGTVNLAAGSNTFTAKICDNVGNCTTKTATYTYDGTAPGVTVNPNGGTYNAASRSITIDWSDNLSLDSGSRVIKLNGFSVKGNFNYYGSATSAHDTGTVNLAAGGNTFMAEICDNAGNCNTKNITYTYDNVAPTVTMSPSGGYFSASWVTDTIQWSDDRGLDDSSRSITVNTADSTNNFTYTGTSTARTSIGVFDLGSEPTLVHAHICDTSGNCTTASATFYRDTTAPTVQLSLASQTYSTASHSFTVTWGDDYALDPATDTIRLNGNNITSLFQYSGQNGSATSTGTITLVEGSNSLTAKICDLAGNCGTNTGTYTYDPPPVVAFSPSGGTFGSHASVRIDWTDNISLDEATREIQLNGGDVTDQFTYAQSAANVAWSEGVVDLSPGMNVLFATICDGSGGCMPVNDTLYSDVAGPTVTISPESFSRVTNDAQAVWPLSVTITWADSHGLDGGSRHVSVNGADSTSAFSFSGNATSDTSTATLQLPVGGTSLDATICDSAGHCTTSHARFNQGVAAAPTVSVATASGGANVARDLCLRIAAGSAEVDCGQLRLSYVLPAIATMNHTRAPVLAYLSEHAAPRSPVAALVALPANATAPDSVIATLTTGSDTITAMWDNSAWLAGRASRIVIDSVARGRTTGLYPYTLEVTNWYGSTPYPANLVSGSLAVVDRSQSPYGAGWWVAGLERVYVFGDTLFWVGGDGSTRVYAPAGTNVWKAPSLTRPDSITAGVGGYTRYLPAGVRVVFDSMGLQQETVNRVGYTTRFTYTNAGGRTAVSRVYLPLASGDSTHYYDFQYDANGRLQTVNAVAGDSIRTVTLGYDGTSRRVNSIEDPDSNAVGFSYENSADSSWITRRTDRRGVPTAFSYGNAGTIDSVVVDPTSLAITTEITAGEGRGAAPSAFDTALAATVIDGPRDDVEDITRIWQDRFGQPTKVQDPLGAVTSTTYADGTFEALPTQLAQPNGFTTQATYTNQGHVQSMTAIDPYGQNPAQQVTTRYAYDANWPDMVTRIVPPEGDSVVIAYDSATGNRIWTQDARGDSTRVHFRYYDSGNAQGLLRAVQLPGSPVSRDSVTYDTYGNLKEYFSALDSKTTHRKNSFGLDTAVVSPTENGLGNVTEQIRYDLMGRVVHTSTSGPAMHNAPAQTVYVSNYFDEVGNLVRVDRWASPDTNQIGTITTYWRYDRAGRKFAEVAPDTTPGDTADNPVETFEFDPAGNVVASTDRRGHTVQMGYDADGRLIWRTTPQVTDYEQKWSDSTTILANREQIQFGGIVIPADLATFSYDSAGRMRTALNNSARITRTYYPNGLLRGDTLRIGAWADPDDFGSHVYGLEMGYDQDGRRIWLKHPSQLAPAAGDTAHFAYDPQTGALKTVTDPIGNQFQYSYDARGDVRRLGMPGGVYQAYDYTLEGRLHVLDLLDPNDMVDPTHEVLPTGGDSLGHTVFTYDQRGRTIAYSNTYGAQEQVTTLHSGLGYVVADTMISHLSDGMGDVPRTAVETFRYDGFGNAQTNIMSISTNGSEDKSFARSGTRGYQPATGRLLWAGMQDYQYDAAGNMDFMYTLDPPGRNGDLLGERAMYYDAADRVWAADSREGTDSLSELYAQHMEWYRYDALGRRVLVYRVNNCLSGGGSPAAGECSLDMIRRTVWDGNQELYEIQMPTGAVAAGYAENDTLPVAAGDLYANPSPTFNRLAFFGHVGYTFGLILDQPLSVMRMNYRGYNANNETGHDWGDFTIVPLWNGQGKASLGYIAESSVHFCLGDSASACIMAYFPESFETLEGLRSNMRWAFHGTLTEGKRDRVGTYYRRNRQYDPVTGQFTQEDPIGLAGGINLYGFAGGDPVSLSDPFGLCSEEDGWTGCPWGSQAGQEATQYWANLSETGSNPVVRGVATVAGLFSSLWTPETATNTGLTLATTAAGPLVESGLFGASTGRVFWSGGAKAQAAAEAYADATGGSTLGGTWAGRALTWATNKVGYSKIKPLWKAASAIFAAGTKGEANVFLSSTYDAAESIYANIEKPLLQLNRCVNLIEHFVP